MKENIVIFWCYNNNTNKLEYLSTPGTLKMEYWRYDTEHKDIKSIMTFSIMTFGIMTLSIMTLSITK
jgi:hypothetical protein